MHWFDFFVIVIILLGFSSYGILQGKLNNSSEDYFLGGRKIPWLVAMFSIVATETSVLTFISVPGLAYRDNWFFLQLALGYIIGRILVSFILLPQYFNSGITSIYEVIGNNFGQNVQKIASGIFLITRVLADGVRFLATSVVVQVITGWSLPFSVLIIGFVTLVYTLSGGIKTIVWIDTIQFILYLIGGIISIIIAFNYLDLPFQKILFDLKNNGKLATINFYGNALDDPYYFISAILGGALLSFSSHGVDYMMVQRLLGTKNLVSAKKAMIGSGVFVFIQFVIFLFAGSLIYLVMDGIAIQKDREFTTFIINYLPIGIKGLLLAGVLSAAMSTLSSSINSLASSTVSDWLNGKSSLKKSRLISFIWGMLLILIALLFDEGDSSVVIIGLQIASFTYGGLLGLFLLSKFNIKFHSISLIVGLISSLLIVFYLKNINVVWTWFIGISVLVNILITLLTEIVINKKIAWRSN